MTIRSDIHGCSSPFSLNHVEVVWGNRNVFHYPAITKINLLDIMTPHQSIIFFPIGQGYCYFLLSSSIYHIDDHDTFYLMRKEVGEITFRRFCIMLEKRWVFTFIFVYRGCYKAVKEVAVTNEKSIMLKRLKNISLFSYVSYKTQMIIFVYKQMSVNECQCKIWSKNSLYEVISTA